MRSSNANFKLSYTDNHVGKIIKARRHDAAKSAASKSAASQVKKASLSPQQNADKKKHLPSQDGSPDQNAEEKEPARQTRAERKREKHQKRRAAREEAARRDAELEQVVNDYAHSADLSLLYPTANAIERFFEIHVGLTNSGKTHSSLQALKQADSGTYLAPLRLLAIEVEETLCAEGVSCSLVTGEEQDIKENATHVSSTVEMADFSRIYDVAVIDECQMISDRQRGGGWTAAIAGIMAREVHLCTAPEALDLLVRIVESLGCDYEIIEHERACPLVVEARDFSYPDDVESGDALVAFSRKEVLHIAGELKRTGRTVSIIYGALPYAARREEVRKFAEGETDVVVATDAIGMGLNLPIRRVVFMDLSKFDGVQRRRLKYTEIRQIAGRAGRYGRYEIGYVNTLTDKEFLKKALLEEPTAASSAVLDFPVSFLKMELPVSKMMDIWSHAKDSSPRFVKSDATDQVMLARIVEMRRYADLDKESVYRLSMIPFDVKNEDLLAVWSGLVSLHGKRDDIDSYIMTTVKRYSDSVDRLDLATSEYAHKLADLCYSYKRAFDMLDAVDVMWFREVKDAVAFHIIDLLSERGTYDRACKYCGEDLPWNYPYTLCEDCYQETYGWKKVSSF